MIFWFHFHKLRYAHYRSSCVALIGMQSLGMNQRANIRNVNSNVVKDFFESEKDNLENGFLKPEYPFKVKTLKMA